MQDHIHIGKSPLFEQRNLETDPIILEYNSPGYGDLIDLVPLLHSILRKYQAKIIIRTNKSEVPFHLLHSERIEVQSINHPPKQNGSPIIHFEEVLNFNINCPTWLRYFIFLGLEELYLFNDPFPEIDKEKEESIQNKFGNNYIIFHTYNSRQEFDGRNTERKNVVQVLEKLQKEGFDIYEVGNDNADPVGKHLKNLSHEELILLIKNSKGFVGIDSYPMHIAALYQKPILGFFGSTHPFSVLPLFRPIQFLRNESLECLDCLALRKIKNDVAKCTNEQELCRYLDPDQIDRSIDLFLNDIHKVSSPHYYLDFLKYMISIGKSEFELQLAMDDLLNHQLYSKKVLQKVLSPHQYDLAKKTKSIESIRHEFLRKIRSLFS